MITNGEKRDGRESLPSLPNSSQGSCVSEGLSAPPSIACSQSIADTEGLTSRTVTLVCARCGKNFERSAKERRRQLRRYGKRETARAYCSKACASVPNPGWICACGKRKAARAKICRACYLDGKIERLKCRQCLKEFNRPSHEVSRNFVRHGTNASYCGRSCYDLFRSLHPRPAPAATGRCAVCESPIVAKKKYCGMECYAARAKRKDREYSGKWDMQKRAVSARDGGVCAHCGQKRDRVAVHHIDHNARNHEMLNLVILCEPCHSHYHQRTSERVRTILRRYFAERASGL